MTRAGRCSPSNLRMSIARIACSYNTAPALDVALRESSNSALTARGGAFFSAFFAMRFSLQLSMGEHSMHLPESQA